MIGIGEGCWYATVWVLVASLGGFALASQDGLLPSEPLQSFDIPVVARIASVAAAHPLGASELDLAPLLARNYQNRQWFEAFSGKLAYDRRACGRPSCSTARVSASSPGAHQNTFRESVLVLRYFPRR
ncbi:hypothetical protein HRbin36_02790 [bacterium HR36]|nr:hypothetical protein HRbin36_02790 [bacterium HR36]